MNRNHDPKTGRFIAKEKPPAPYDSGEGAPGGYIFAFVLGAVCEYILRHYFN